MLTICLLILIYSMLKKPVASLVAKIKDADWKRPARNAWNKILEYSRRAGREATRIVLRFYYALTDGDLSPKDKALVYAGIIYIVVPHDLLPKKTLGLLGLEEGIRLHDPRRGAKGERYPERLVRVRRKGL